MSNLLKSKFLLGVMVVAVMVVGFAVSASSASAQTCSITTTLRVGSRGSQVVCLQASLDNGIVADGVFGQKTKARVVAWQASVGLVADGVFGPKSRAVWLGGFVSGNFPAGCTSASGFSSTTGMPCNTVPSGLPAGCTSASGFSPTTGVSCSTGVPPTTTQSGPVSAALASDNPASGTIVAGQATADLLHVTFSGNGTVNSVTLTRSGVSDQNTLTNVYLYDGVQRLTDGYSFNTNSTITINNLGLVVNGSRTISVKADVSATTTSYDLLVTLTSFTTAGGSPTLVNIRGNDMFVAGGSSLASASLSCNTVIGSGGITTAGACAPGAALSVNAGTTNYRVWSAPLQVNTRALWLKAANFRITGSAPSDALQNVGLYIDGVKAGSNATLTMTNGSNYLSFNMTANPVSLSTGSHTIEVRGDVTKGSSFSFAVSLQQASDIMVTDPQVGVNLALGSSGYSSFQANTAASIGIGTGTFTSSIDPSFSVFNNVTAGASNVTIARFKLHGYGEDVKVTSLPITPVVTNACTSGTSYGVAPCNVTTAGATHTQFATGNGLQNVTLYFNGSQVGTQQSWGSGALSFVLGSQMIIPAGVDSILEVRADMRTSPGSAGAADATAPSGVNYTAGNVSANLGAATAEGWNSHASITGPTTTGNILSMQSGLLALSKNAGYASQNQNPNTAGVKIGSFVLQNQSSSESIRVTTLAVNIAYGAGTTSANLSGLRTSETSGNAGTPVQPATAAASGNATNTFSTDFTLAPGQIKTIDIFADSGADTGVTATVITTLTVTSIGTTSNVSATSTATAGQTITFSVGTITNPPTLVVSSSTAAQFVPAANGGATNATKATYNFASTGGSSTITELKFNISGATTGTFVSVNGIQAPFVGGVADVTGLSLAVPFGGSGLNQDVFVSYPEVGISGLASGTTSALSLTFVKYTSGGTTTTITPTVAAPTMVLVGSKPSYTVIDSTDTLANGQVKIAEVTVSADAKGDIKVGQIAISVASTGPTNVAAAADNIVVKDSNNVVVPTTNASFTVPAGGTGTGIICFDTAVAACASGQAAANGYLLPAGTSKTFRIYVTAAGVTGAVGTTSLSTTLGAAANTKWYDVAGNNTTALTSTSVFNYPTNPSVITN